MCGRYTLGREPDSLLDYFHLHGEVPVYHLSYNIAPSQTVPVIVQDVNHNRECRLMRWGLVPHWAKQVDTRFRMINARCETVAQKPAYRDAFRSSRCLVPADGFYEWQQTADGKQPFYIYKSDNALFAMAGVWSKWQSTDNQLLTFSILTTPANTFMQSIHERMPVILSEPDYDAWLDPQTNQQVLLDMLQAHKQVELAMHPVSKAVNSPDNDTKSLIKAVG